MKKIVILFLTFSGICTTRAQKPAGLTTADSIKRSSSFPAQQQKKDSLLQKPLVRISPNPASNKVEITIRGFDPGHVQIQVSDMNGNPVKTDKRLVVNGNEIIVLMFSITPGIYVLSVRQDKKQARTKLIVR